MVSIVAAALLAGSLVYSVMAIVAAWRYLSVRPPPLNSREPISILKPLAGLDLDLETNLRTYFEQDYQDFEILFAARQANDPALSIVEKLRKNYPRVPCRVFVTGEPPYANAKVYSLDRMVRESANDLVVMSDSDVRVTPSLLRTVAAEFQDPKLGVATCPYRAVAGMSFWSRLEAIGMNTEFLAGVLVAWLIGEMDFALGPTLAARREVIEAMGGFADLGHYLAEDFVIGNRAPRLGYRVVLSSCVIEHRIGSQTFKGNLQHRLRWARSTRRSRPAGYWGEIFTNPLPLALLLGLAAPKLWPLLVATIFFRALAAWSTANWVLHDPLTRRRWWLVPIQDLMSFLVWVAGFFGNTIDWRGRRYKLLRDGRFQFVGKAITSTAEAPQVGQASAASSPQPDITPNKTNEEIFRR